MFSIEHMGIYASMLVFFDWLMHTELLPATPRTASVKKGALGNAGLIYLSTAGVWLYLKRAAAAVAARVATSRQELESPATTASDTAANPAPLEKRCTLEGCLQARTHTQITLSAHK